MTSKLLFVVLCACFILSSVAYDVWQPLNFYGLEIPVNSGGNYGSFYTNMDTLPLSATKITLTLSGANIASCISTNLIYSALNVSCDPRFYFEYAPNLNSSGNTTTSYATSAVWRATSNSKRTSASDSKNFYLPPLVAKTQYYIIFQLLNQSSNSNASAYVTYTISTGYCDSNTYNFYYPTSDCDTSISTQQISTTTNNIYSNSMDPGNYDVLAIQMVNPYNNNVSSPGYFAFASLSVSATENNGAELGSSSEASSVSESESESESDSASDLSDNFVIAAARNYIPWIVNGTLYADEILHLFTNSSNSTSNPVLPLSPFNDDDVLYLLLANNVSSTVNLQIGLTLKYCSQDQIYSQQQCVNINTLNFTNMGGVTGLLSFNGSSGYQYFAVQSNTIEIATARFDGTTIAPTMYINWYNATSANDYSFGQNIPSATNYQSRVAAHNVNFFNGQIGGTTAPESMNFNETGYTWLIAVESNSSFVMWAGEACANNCSASKYSANANACNPMTGVCNCPGYKNVDCSSKIFPVLFIILMAVACAIVIALAILIPLFIYCRSRKRAKYQSV